MYPKSSPRRAPNGSFQCHPRSNGASFSIREWSGKTYDCLIMRGARKLATLGPVADEVLVFSLPGIRPGDEACASVFGLPLDTPGVKLICREPHGDGGRSAFDHPLAVNFDETDALLVFDV